MNTTVAINVFAFAVLTVLWIGFAAALFLKPGLLQQVWQTFRRWNVVLQLVLALLVLPVVVGLWIWQTRWPIWLRLLLLAALAWTTEYTFFPRVL